jgi:hypothetical protein
LFVYIENESKQGLRCRRLHKVRAGQKGKKKEKEDMSKYFNARPQKPQVRNRRDADKLITSAHKVAALLYLTVLHDKYGFGTKRLEDVLAYFNDLLDSYNKGYISIDDLNNTLYEETGIKVV